MSEREPDTGDRRLTITADQRRRWGRIGGLTLRARNDSKVYTAAARETFIGSFLSMQPGDLPPAERQARARAALRARMLVLAERSAAARRAKAGRDK